MSRSPATTFMGMDAKFPRVGSAAVVRDGRGRVLLGVRLKEPNRGKLVIPGGGIKPFESAAAAAVREVKEETGLDIVVDGVFTVSEIINEPDEHRIIIYHEAHVVGDAAPTGGSDLGDPTFHDLSDLAGLNLSDVVRDVLNGYSTHYPAKG